MTSAGSVNDAPQPTRPRAREMDPAAPRESDTEAFAHALGEKRGRRDARTSRAGGARATPDDESGAKGEDVADLFRRAAAAMSGARPAVSDAAAANGEGRPVLAAPAGSAPADNVTPAIDRRYDELVERILVARPGPHGREEVRIALNRAWLPETEVRMVREPDSGLSVEFVSDEAEAQRFLLPNLSALRERLADRSGERVSVRMSMSWHDGAGGDGRGRNRRNLYDEMMGQ